MVSGLRADLRLAVRRQVLRLNSPVAHRQVRRRVVLRLDLKLNSPVALRQVRRHAVLRHRFAARRSAEGKK